MSQKKQLWLIELFLQLNLLVLINAACTIYTVRPGDTCEAIGINANLNPHIDCSVLRPGQRVCIHVSSPCGPKSDIHTVQYGDTCYALGIRQELYPTLDCTNLKVGDRICILKKPDAAHFRQMPVCPHNRYYKIVKGDTCYLIGKLFGYNFYNLIALNYWDINCNNLQIGQIICV